MYGSGFKLFYFRLYNKVFQQLNPVELTESFDQDQEIDLRQLSNAGLIKDCAILYHYLAMNIF